MNKVILIGNLTKDPEHKQTPNGVSVCAFSIAVNRRMNKDVTDYFSIVAWRGLADICSKYLKKGQKVSVVGELQTRTYDDKNGVKRYVTEVSAEEVEFLAKANGNAQTGAQSAKQPANADQFAQEMGGVIMDDDEDLPF